MYEKTCIFARFYNIFLNSKIQKIFERLFVIFTADDNKKNSPTLASLCVGDFCPPFLESLVPVAFFLPPVEQPGKSHENNLLVF
jgi:hypothetical protein